MPLSTDIGNANSSAGILVLDHPGAGFLRHLFPGCHKNRRTEKAHNKCAASLNIVGQHRSGISMPLHTDRNLKILGIAAGHGLYGIAFAKNNPQAEIVALDWAPVLEVANENVRNAAVSDRCSTTIPFESNRAITAGGTSPFDTREGRALFHVPARRDLAGHWRPRLS